MEGIHYYVQTGPYVGYGIGKAKEKYCYDGNCEEEKYEYDSTGEEGPKPLDFGAQFGAGVHIYKNIYFDARYILGLQNLIGDDDSHFNNNTIFLNVAYKF